MALNTQLTLKIVAALTSGLDLGSTALVPLSTDWSDLLATGVVADQADKLFFDNRSLAGTTAESLDLAGGLTDGLGAVVTFVRIKGIFIRPAAANNGVLAIGGAGANDFVNWVASATDIINIRPGGLFVLWSPDATGYPVTGGTGDLLKINNTGAGVGTYDIVLIGASA